MFRKEIEKFVTCEVKLHDNVRCFAKLSNGSWSAVKDDGSLDWVEVGEADFNDMLESLKSVRASVRFTNHSAA